ncbi:MAG: type II secretion system F family protein [Thermodesulfobacteriota bacterium]
MPVFVWEGRANGRLQKGEIEAPNKSAVIARLRQMRVIPIPERIKEKGRLFDLSKIFAGMGGGVGNKDLVIFTRQLSVMVDAGLPLVRSLDILASQNQNLKFAGILRSVKESVESGTTFAEALAKHPSAFDKLYVNLVRAGETGGVLDTILQRLATFLEKIEAIKRRIKGAMIYPAVVITVAITVIAVIMIFVVPTFAEMFKDMGTTLPGLTLMIMGISTFLKNNIIYILIAIFLTFMAITYVYRKTYRGRKLIDAFKLRFPLMGDLILKTVLARFCRTLATLMTGGISILDALEITAKASGNVITEEAIMGARKAVSEGKTLADPLARHPRIFPPIVVQMIAVGEQTGALDEMLNKIADFYEDEVDVAVASLLQALEPIMIAGLGGTVGVIVIAMYLPMFKMIGAMSE